MDINPSLQIPWLVRQRNRSWIRGLGKKPQNSRKSELIHWRQCLLSGATEPCPLGFRETFACIHVILHNVTATCGVLTRLPYKLAKNGMRVKTSADPRLKNKLQVYMASEANWLMHFEYFLNSDTIKKSEAFSGWFLLIRLDSYNQVLMHLPSFVLPWIKSKTSTLILPTSLLTVTQCFTPPSLTFCITSKQTLSDTLCDRHVWLSIRIVMGNQSI